MTSPGYELNVMAAEAVPDLPLLELQVPGLPEVLVPKNQALKEHAL